MNKQKGITLIALIITAIVMLILVGVTINVALSGGLIEKATTASNQTQIEVLKEKAELAKANAYAESIKNGTILDANNVAVAIAEELEGTATENYVTVETTKGRYYVVVDNELKVTVTKTEPQTKPAEVDDLIPTDAEKALASYNSAAGMYTYLSGDNEMLYYVERDSKKGIQIQLGDLEGYMYASEGDFGSLVGIENMQLNKWYKYKYDGEDITSIYTGHCPIEFTEEQLQNNTYLKRIYDSFNNAN